MPQGRRKIFNLWVPSGKAADKKKKKGRECDCCIKTVRPKKPARNTREYIDRKKENAIFAPP